MRAEYIEYSIVLLQTCLYCGFRDMVLPNCNISTQSVSNAKEVDKKDNNKNIALLICLFTQNLTVSTQNHQTEACHVLSSFENLVEKFVDKEDIFYPKMRFNGVFCKSMLTRIISLWMLLVFIVYPVCILLVKERKQRHKRSITIRINFIFFSFITSLKKDGAGQSAPLIL